MHMHIAMRNKIEVEPHWWVRGMFWCLKFGSKEYICEDSLTSMSKSKADQSVPNVQRKMHHKLPLSAFS
jgi:hypothetical protein